MKALGLLLLIAVLAPVKPPQASDAKSAYGMRSLLAQKEAVLSDLCGGLYCNVCHRTKAEIEKAGENFQKHIGLNAMRATPKPATPAMLMRAAEKYDVLLRWLCGLDLSGGGANPAAGNDC